MGNSIYDYYKKVSDRYFSVRISSEVKYEWDLKPTSVSIPGYEDYDLFLQRENNYYILREALTGIVILRQCDVKSRAIRKGTQQMFTDFLAAELSELGGHSWLNRRMYDFILDYRKHSPRYIKL